MLFFVEFLMPVRPLLAQNGVCMDFYFCDMCKIWGRDTLNTLYASVIRMLSRGNTSWNSLQNVLYSEYFRQTRSANVWGP